MLLIYYNPHKNSFYLKKVNPVILDKEVGYINQFDHILVQILCIHKNKFLSVLSFYDYQNKTKEKKTKKNKNKLIDGIIHLLYKFKD